MSEGRSSLPGPLGEARAARGRALRGVPATLALFLSVGVLGCSQDAPPSGGPDPADRPDMGTTGPDPSRPDLARPQTPTWRWESPMPQGNNLRGVFGVAGASAASDEIYAVGDSGTLIHRTRSGWAPEAQDLMDGRALLAIAGSGSADSLQLLAVGVYDKVLYRGGGLWQEVDGPTGGSSGTLTAAWGSTVPGEFYVVGTTGRVYHVRGTVWQREAQNLVTQYLGGVWGKGTGADQEVYAVGASGKVLHRSGGSWAVEADGLAVQQLNAVTGAGDAVYAVGDAGTILRKGGDGKWALEAAPTTANLTTVWGVGDEVFALGQRGTVLRRSAGAWRAENVTVTGELISAAWGAVRGAQLTLYAVGNLGTVLRREQATWSQISARVTPTPLSSVWARSSDEVYAVGPSGLILRRRGTASLGAWTVEGDGATSESLNAIGGWAATREGGDSDVYAVGTSGTILHRLAGAWVLEGAVLTGQELTSVWVGPDAVVAVGRGGRILRKQDGKWGLEALPPGVAPTDLLSVWGAGAGQSQVVYASGAGGLLLRRSGGVWAKEADGVTGEALVSVFGRGTDEVFVLGNKGAFLRRVNSQWQLESLQLSGRTPVTGCASPSGGNLYSIATNGLILRRGAGSWTSDAPGLTNLELTAITAPGAEEVFAVGAGGVILHRY